MSGNLIDLCPVGALTNGPYAFTSRPFELMQTETIDLMDAIGANVQVDARGSEVLRVLPRINEEVNEEWLADKGRFSYDGLKKQRLNVPLVKKADGTFEEMDWMTAISQVADKMNEVSGDQMAAIIGEFADVESVIALKDLMNRFDCDNFEIRSDATKLNADLRSSYMMNSRIEGIEDTDFLLLVGVNPKTEAPLLNARILKSITNNKLKVAYIGPAADLGYEVLHLGNSTRTLIEVAEGRHPVCARLANAQLPMILTGARTLERTDGQAIQSALSTIALHSPVINESLGWNGFNVLHKDGARVGALDVGVSNNYNQNLKPKFVFILGADNIRTSDIPEDAFVVYLGTHGDEGAYFANVILPGATYMEKTATYVNTEGRVQVSRLVVPPPGQAKEDWQILRALSEECGVALPYDSYEELRYRMGELAPHLLKYDHIEPSLFGKVALQSQVVSSNMHITPLNDQLDNYYQSDAISRSSTIMAKCSAAFNPDKFSNFKSRVPKEVSERNF